MRSPVVTEDATEVLFAVAETLSEADVTTEAELAAIVAKVSSISATIVAVIEAAVLRVVALPNAESVADLATVAAVKTHAVRAIERRTMA